MHHGFKHQPVALGLMIDKMHMRTCCLCFAFAHPHNNAMLCGCSGACNDPLSMKHSNGCNHLTART
jgi:hypothetical protein